MFMHSAGKDSTFFNFGSLYLGGPAVVQSGSTLIDNVIGTSSKCRSQEYKSKFVLILFVYTDNSFPLCCCGGVRFLVLARSVHGSARGFRGLIGLESELTVSSKRLQWMEIK